MQQYTLTDIMLGCVIALDYNVNMEFYRYKVNDSDKSFKELPTGSSGWNRNTVKYQNQNNFRNELYMYCDNAAFFSRLKRDMFS